MRKYGLVILFLITTFLICQMSEVQVYGLEPRIKVQEIDGSPSGRPRVLRITNGLLTDNGGGKFTLEIDKYDTGVQTITDGKNINNSGTAKNPIFDLEISENVDMDTNQLTNLKIPSADGMAIRQTSKITEPKLEDADDKKHTQNSDTKLDDGQSDEVTAADLRIHLDNLTKHREIDDSSTADTRLWSGSKINAELLWVDEVPLSFRMTWDDADTYLQHFQIRVGEGNCADTGVYVVDKESKDNQANWTYFSPDNILQIPAAGVDYLHNHLLVQYTTGQSVLSKNVMYNIWKRVYNATDSVYGDWDWLGGIIK